MGRVGCPRWLTVGLVVAASAAASWVQGSVAGPRNSQNFFPEPLLGTFSKWDDLKLKHLNNRGKVSVAARESSLEEPEKFIQMVAEDYYIGDKTGYQQQEKKTFLEYGDGRPWWESNSIWQGGSSETKEDAAHSSSQGKFHGFASDAQNSQTEEGSVEDLFSAEDSEGSGSGDHEGSGGDQEDSVEEEGSEQQESESPQNLSQSTVIKPISIDVSPVRATRHTRK